MALRIFLLVIFFFFSSRRRHTRFKCDWSSDVCSSDLVSGGGGRHAGLLPGDPPPGRDGSAEAEVPGGGPQAAAEPLVHAAGPPGAQAALPGGQAATVGGPQRLRRLGLRRAPAGRLGPVPGDDGAPHRPGGGRAHGRAVPSLLRRRRPLAPDAPRGLGGLVRAGGRDRALRAAGKPDGDVAGVALAPDLALQVRLEAQGVRPSRGAAAGAPGLTVRTIAVDWSGRKQGAARHIWAAEVAAGGLVSLSNGRTGPQLAGWLVGQASAGEGAAGWVGLSFFGAARGTADVGGGRGARLRGAGGVCRRCG